MKEYVLFFKIHLYVFIFYFTGTVLIFFVISILMFSILYQLTYNASIAVLENFVNFTEKSWDGIIFK